MKSRRSMARRVTEGLLAFCAICLWMYDFHLISSQNPYGDEVNAGTIAHQPLVAVTFPWHDESLPWIPWSPFATPDEELVEGDLAELEAPAWLVKGTYSGATKNGALIYDSGSGQSRLLLTGEEWEGTTLHTVGKGWVICSREGKRWQLSMPSMNDPNK